MTILRQQMTMTTSTAKTTTTTPTTTTVTNTTIAIVTTTTATTILAFDDGWCRFVISVEGCDAGDSYLKIIFFQFCRP